MRKIFDKNEKTLVKEMDFLQQNITNREEEIKKLNFSLQSVKSRSNEDRNKWQRKTDTLAEHSIILKKMTKLLRHRLNTLIETVDVLRRESALTLGVRCKPSHQLKLLIEKQAHLEQEYDQTQKDLKMLLGGHKVNMTTAKSDKNTKLQTLEEEPESSDDQFSRQIELGKMVVHKTDPKKDMESQPLVSESLEEQERVMYSGIHALSKENDMLVTGLSVIRDRHSPDDEILSADDIASNEETDHPSSDSPFDGSVAITNFSEPMHDTMPDKDYLKSLCASHGIKSDQLKYECEKLCNIIHNFEHVVDVYPAYKENDVTSVFFIVTVSRQSDNLPIHLDDIRIDWVIKSIDISRYKISGNIGIKMKEHEIQMLRVCFGRHAHALMNKHRYLSIIESCNYTLNKETECATNALQYEARLALYVHAKGYIPINEEPFEKSYDGIPVVVKEGVYIPFVNTANMKHPHVRMGCQIQRAQLAVNGTLGLFVEHSTYGLCGLTCAHVMLSKEEHARCKANNGFIHSDSFLNDIDVFQPEHPHLLGKLVEAIQKEGSEREEGIDLALIQINERHPVDGKFPETEIDIDFESGKTLKPSIRNDRCYKFGKASGFTNGTLIITEQLSVIKDVLDFQGYHCVLWNQIKVQPSGQLFATNGDSGAPVFVKDGDGQLACVGIIVGGTTDGMVYVTPVTRILQEFGISQLKTFIPNIADLAKDIHSIKRTLEQLSYTVQAHMSNT
ncbi:uncharacterized protein LOC127879571 isoform X2 [Dreissena polymorpha]|nr:uncharacterized protein LOC127879571 isoform X2 [Dreissena polymorpha]